MVFVDSSVWIDFFKSGEKSESLVSLLNLDLVCTNEIVMIELLPVLRLQKNIEIIESLSALFKSEMNIFWEGLQQLQLTNLKNGINNVGIPDLIIAQHCIYYNLELWTFDKHFEIMAKHLNLKIFKP